jgi:hypothetical protein
LIHKQQSGADRIKALIFITNKIPGGSV